MMTQDPAPSPVELDRAPHRAAPTRTPATFGIEEEFVLLDRRTLSTVDLGLAAVAELTGSCPGAVVREFFPSQVEFATPVWTPMRWAYQRIVLGALPMVAKRVASNAEAYRYLTESILGWPDQESLARAIDRAGWSNVEWRDLTGGIVAMHRAINPGDDGSPDTAPDGGDTASETVTAAGESSGSAGEPVSELADEPAGERRLGLYLGDLIRVGSDDVVHGLFDGPGVGHLLHAAAFDNLGWIAAFGQNDLEQILGDLAGDGL